ncbi:MAG: bacteriohemerythrin [Sulfurovaceae bacterium]|nr:bacteriohemerythrin [Sulfurovaceae bacterium]MDD5549329.1 bacteriohemerythrin [Sulfurovaceae bacterium]
MWTWESKYSVGIEVIDHQHKRLIEYINELGIAGAYRSFENRRRVQDVLIKLVDYTISHFSFEEELMEEAGYPMLAPHIKVHEAFVERVAFFKQRFEDGEDITKQLVMDLQMWLINHIQRDDADYKDIVQKALLKKNISPNEKAKKDKWLSSLVKKFFG